MHNVNFTTVLAYDRNENNLPVPADRHVMNGQGILLCGLRPSAISRDAHFSPARIAKDDPKDFFCPVCRERALAVIRSKYPNLTVAGHRFHLETVERHIRGERANDFIASLYCDDNRLGTVENTGDGTPTVFHAGAFSDKKYVRRIEKEVLRFLRPNLKTIISAGASHDAIRYRDLGSIADRLMQQF